MANITEFTALYSASLKYEVKIHLKRASDIGNIHQQSHESPHMDYQS